MKDFLLRVIVAGLFSLIIVFQAAAFTFPNYDNIYVNDYAGLLSGEVERDLTSRLKQAEQQGTQITLLTINNLSDYGAGPKIEPFATALFNHWGVGDAKKNNGVMILVARNDRKMRIELGSGYPSSRDRQMKSIIDGVFIPYFKRNNYSDGISRGTIATITAIIQPQSNRSAQEEATVNNFSSDSYESEIRFDDLIVNQSELGWVDYVIFKIKEMGLLALAILAPIFGGLIMGIRAIWRRYPRSCSVCENKMYRLPENVEDEHLEGAQKLEEYLKSVDYDVWRCQACSRIDIYRYKNWFSRYKVCEECGYKTLQATTTVLEHATTSSTGRKRIDYLCKNCKFTDYEIRTIPRRSESSSSSGSFGGGSSSGGGASGSW